MRACLLQAERQASAILPFFIIFLTGQVLICPLLRFIQDSIGTLDPLSYLSYVSLISISIHGIYLFLYIFDLYVSTSKGNLLAKNLSTLFYLIIRDSFSIQFSVLVIPTSLLVQR
jgi:hypothetical protein